MHVVETIPDKDRELIESYQRDWCKFARDIFGAKLDNDQQDILESVQHNRRTVVRSGHARGKDFVAAIASLCFLYLNCPSKVINTAPTQRQVEKIMMAEIGTLFNNANNRLREHGWSLGGYLQSTRVIFRGVTNWFLEAFKSADKSIESWTGFHSRNIMVVITEASGVEDETFVAIEGLLTGGNARLLLVGNPNRLQGEFYQAFKSTLYNKFVLNCLNAPNVLSKTDDIPGQVDWVWVDEHVRKTGWTQKITKESVSKKYFDFQWEGSWYRPSNLFLVKVIGEFPDQDDSSLVPLAWIEAANRRWDDLYAQMEEVLNEYKLGRNQNPMGAKIIQERYKLNIEKFKEVFKLGVDVAGMGNDLTVFSPRLGMYVGMPDVYSKQGHMVTAGRIVSRLKVAGRNGGGRAYVDTIGEGAGVYARVIESLEEARDDLEKLPSEVKAISVKFSEEAHFLHDFSGEREFANMRAYCLWALRDNLDPAYDGQLALPRIDELTNELTEMRWEIMSNGKIKIEPKEDLKLRLGRSPDYSDSIAVTFYPRGEYFDPHAEDTMKGLGIF